MNDKVQNQTGGDGSQNVQSGPGGNIIVNNGLSIQDAKEIVLLLVEQDFARFSEKAVIVARERAEQMVDEFLQKVSAKNPNLIESVESPGMQMALIRAQQEHVKTGDKDIRDILVNALVQRASIPDRGILQISIDESLVAIGKLTMKQINVLTLCLVLYHAKFPLSSASKSVMNISSVEDSKNLLINILNGFIEKFLDEVPLNYSNYVHIASCNCGDIIMGSNHFVNNLLNNYPGLFCKGFTISELSAYKEIESIIDDNKFPNFFVPCLNDDLLWQAPFTDYEELDNWVNSNNIDYSVRAEFRRLMTEKVFTETEMIVHVSNWGESMVRLLGAWKDTGLKHLTLNNIGKAVAAMNFNRVYNADRSLSMWISE